MRVVLTGKLYVSVYVLRQTRSLQGAIFCDRDVDVDVDVDRDGDVHMETPRHNYLGREIFRCRRRHKRAHGNIAWLKGSVINSTSGAFSMDELHELSCVTECQQPESGLPGRRHTNQVWAEPFEKRSGTFILDNISATSKKCQLYVAQTLLMQAHN